MKFLKMHKKSFYRYCRKSFARQWVFKFDNGYGASVVEFLDEDAPEGYELAVVIFDDNGDWHGLENTQAFPGDVMPGLSDRQVRSYLERIKRLRPRATEKPTCFYDPWNLCPYHPGRDCCGCPMSADFDLEFDEE